MTAAQYALQILQWIQIALAGGLDVQPILDEGDQMLNLFIAENRGPTDAEWQAALQKRHDIEAQIAAAAARIQ